MEIKIKKDETYYTFNIVEITFTYLVIYLVILR